MTARIIDGNALSALLREELALRAASLTARGVTPCLAVILVGEDPASAVYVRNKVTGCEKAGIRSIKDVYPPDVDPAVVLARRPLLPCLWLGISARAGLLCRRN